MSPALGERLADCSANPAPQTSDAHQDLCFEEKKAVLCALVHLTSDQLLILKCQEGDLDIEAVPTKKAYHFLKMNSCFVKY